MSSTSGVQNFLVNVFRPVYTYDATTTLFTPKLELSNIDNYSGNTISVFTAAVGDSNSNVYVGSNAGNPYTTTKLSRNVTAVGFGAGSNISNVSNSTYIGYYAGAGAVGANNNVAIGNNTNGNGTSNVYVGSGTGGGGSSNVFLGAGITGTGSSSILIGPGLTDGSTNSVFKLGQTYLTGNLSTKWLGLGTTAPYDPNNKLDISGNLYVFGQQGINMVPIRTLDVNGNFRASDANGTLDFTLGKLGLNTPAVRTLDVSGTFRASDANGTLDFNLGVTSSSNGFASRTGTITTAGIGSITNIATLKKGVILVSAQDTASASHYESVMKFCPDVTDGNTCVTMTNGTQAGDVTLVFQTAGSNIQISNATSTRDIAWSVTYYPLP